MNFEIRTVMFPCYVGAPEQEGSESSASHSSMWAKILLMYNWLMKILWEMKPSKPTNPTLFTDWDRESISNQCSDPGLIWITAEIGHVLSFLSLDHNKLPLEAKVRLLVLSFLLNGIQTFSLNNSLHVCSFFALILLKTHDLYLNHELLFTASEISLCFRQMHLICHSVLCCAVNYVFSWHALNKISSLSKPKK